jgi:hypothetical protein
MGERESNKRLDGVNVRIDTTFSPWTGSALLVRTTSTIIAKRPGQHSPDRSPHHANQAIDSSGTTRRLWSTQDAAFYQKHEHVRYGERDSASDRRTSESIRNVNAIDCSW